jgi:hypothetical protein
MSFIMDNAGYILAGVSLYTGGCYTPKTYNALKARFLAWLAK